MRTWNKLFHFYEEYYWHDDYLMCEEGYQVGTKLIYSFDSNDWMYYFFFNILHECNDYCIYHTV